MAISKDILDSLEGVLDDIQAAYPSFNRKDCSMKLFELETDATRFPAKKLTTWIRIAYKFLARVVKMEIGDEWSEKPTSLEFSKIRIDGFLKFFTDRIYSHETIKAETSPCWNLSDSASAEGDAGLSILTAPRRDSFKLAIRSLERVVRRTRVLDYARIVSRHFEIFHLTSDSPDIYYITEIQHPTDAAQEILESKSADLSNKERKSLERFLYNKARNNGTLPKTFYVTNVRKLNEHPFGGGSYGDVYKGQMGEQRVAVKVSRFLWDPETKEKRYRELCKEALIWKPLEHSNVLPFLGICTDGFPSVGLISPFMDNGDLLSYLRGNRNVDKAKIMEKVCFGLQYLHCNEPEVVHGDLKCANILVDDEGGPRIADFGLARVVDVATMTASTGTKGTLRWQAPELVHPSSYTGGGRVDVKTDIYAFGMTCLEIFTEKTPFQDMTDWEVVTMAQKGTALENALGITKGCRWMSSILDHCCRTEADRRPETSEIILLIFGSFSFLNMRSKPLPGIEE